MSRYLLGRLAWFAVALLGVSVVTFALGVLAPGDPAEVALLRQTGQTPGREQIAAKRHELGLDRPVVVQYLRWVGGALHGDLGKSWVRDINVHDAIAERAPRTAALALGAIAIAILIGVPVGVVSATRRNTWLDHLTRAGALLGASVPSYLSAYVLIFLFAVKVKLLPAFGFGSASHLVLPALTLALGPAAVLARLSRSAVLVTLGDDYVRTARAKGVRQTAVLTSHVLRNSLLPIVTVIGLSVGHLLGGSVIVEPVFAWPGMGDLAVSAIHDHDYPLIQGFVLFAAAAYLVVNLLVDLAYAWVDPRVQVTR